MKKRTRIILYSLSTITGLVTTVTSATIISEQTKTISLAKSNHIPSALSLYTNNFSINQMSDSENTINWIINKIVHIVQSNSISFDPNSYTLSLDIHKDSNLFGMTFEQLKNILTNNLITIVAQVQDALTRINVVTKDAPLIIQIKNLKTNASQTDANFQILVTWTNAIPVKEKVINVSIKNLYPPILKNKYELMNDMTISKQKTGWLVLGILSGFGVFVLLAAAIYYLIRKHHFKEIKAKCNNSCSKLETNLNKEKDTEGVK